MFEDLQFFLAVVHGSIESGYDVVKHLLVIIEVRNEQVRVQERGGMRGDRKAGHRIPCRIGGRGHSSVHQGNDDWRGELGRLCGGTRRQYCHNSTELGTH